MAVDVKMSVRTEINRLKKNLTQKSSELVSLKDELRKHERVYKIIAGGRTQRTVRKRGGTKRKATVNWNSVLRGLPRSFTVDNIARETAVGGKPRGYLRQVVARWAKQRKIKRTRRGQYQKV